MTYHAIKQWFLYGDIYQLTSGPIIVGGLIAVFRKHNCHVPRCWRLQWKTTNGGDAVCKHHHPDEPKTHAQILADHRKGGSKD